MSASQDRAAMAQAATRIEQGFDTLNQLKGALDQGRNNAMAQWKGTSADAFSRVVDNFLEKMGKQCDTLSNLHQQMGQARLTYEQAQEEQLEGAKKIESLLGGL